MMLLYSCSGKCCKLVVLEAPQNAISQIPEAFSCLNALKSLNVANNRIATVPSAVLRECGALHTLDVRDNPVTMQQLRDMPGYKEFEERRKIKLDRIVDAKIGADFWEAADYDAYHKH
jgi:Leucine-rich repeat (LRR) protein